MFNFKKMAAVIFAAVIITVPFAVNADYEDINANKNTINIVVDGERVIADNFLYNDTTYVQLRKIAEMLGKKVEWVESENAAYISDTDAPEITDTTAVKLAEEKDKVLSVERNTMLIYVNGEKVEADNFLFEDRTYVPLRKIAEMFENTVSWDQLTNTATIGAKMPSVFDGEVLGTINGREYTQKIFDDYKLAYKVIYGIDEETADDVDTLILEQIKNDYAIIDFALELGVSSGTTFSNEYYDAIDYFATQIGGKEAVKALLSQNGYSEELYYHVNLLNDISANILATGKFTLTPEEAKAFYEENLNIFKYDAVRAKHILVMPQQNELGVIEDAAWDTAKKKIDEVYALATGGSNFDELIATYNEDPGMKSNPDGYTFTKGEMVQEFEDMAYSLEVGEISEPVKTSYGYHVIKLEEKVPYLKYDQNLEDYIVADLTFERFKSYIAELAQKAVVEKK